MIALSKHVETGTNRTGKTNVTEAEEVSFVLPVVTSWSITPQPQLPHMSAACSTKSAYTSLSSLHGQIQWNFNSILEGSEASHLPVTVLGVVQVSHELLWDALGSQPQGFKIEELVQ